MMLSLIVPVYNVAPFLPQCLESLAAASPVADEIIAVDDGSTDDCPRILAEWAQRLPGLRVVRQENGGLSAARNTGLAHACGKYVAFVDSDDFIAPQGHANMVALAEADNLDMVVANAWNHHDGRQPDALIYPRLEDDGVLTGAEWMSRRFARGRLLHMVWMHLYRREFVEAEQLRFIPRLIHEDVLWTTEALLKAVRVQSLDEPVYHYRIRVRPLPPDQRDRQLAGLIESSVINARGMAGFADQASSPVLARQLAWQAVDGGFSVYHKLEQVNDSARRARLAQTLLDDRYAGLLWRHAQDWRQRRRIARWYLKSRLWAGRA